MTYKHRIRIILCSALLLGAVGQGYAGQTVQDVKRIYASIVNKNALHNYPIRVVKSSQINAYNDGSEIVVYTGMLRFVHNADELALVIGHEYAHFRFKSETRADQYGAKYMANAGYNLCHGALIFKSKLFAKGDPPIHPPGIDRWEAMRCGV